MVLAVLQFCLLRYFPRTNLVDHADNCYTSLDYFFLLFFYVSSQNFKTCCYLFLLFFPVFFSALSFPSFYSFLLFFLFPVLFSPSVYSFYSLISLIVFFSNLSAILSFLFSLLYFVCFSLMLYYYSICSLSSGSVSFFLFRQIPLSKTSLLSLLLLHLFSLAILLLFGRGSMTLPVLCSFLSFSLFSFLLFSFCFFMLPFCFCFYSCFHFFCSLLSSILYATPVLTIDLMIFFILFLSPLPLFFSFIFIYFFFIIIIFLALFCLYCFTSAH